MSNKIKPKIKKLWVAALRSGEYKQTHGQLRNEEAGFCCLGVLCNIHAQMHPEIAARQQDPNMYMGSREFPPVAVDEWATTLGDPLENLYVVSKGKQLYRDTLGGFNDDGFTFDEIADMIEKQL